MKYKEPEFMKELHRIRARLTKEWAQMSDKEFLAHMHKVGKDFRDSLRSSKSLSVSK